MKKLAVVLAVVVSGFVNGQTAEEIEQYKKECNCDSAMAVGIHDHIVETSNWANNTHTFKTGDNDKAATLGILQNIFTDPTAKFKYEKINPRIAQLYVNGLFSLTDTISYSKWIASIPVYDTNKYSFRYMNDNANYNYDNADINLHESIDVFDNSTGKCIRTIMIIYNQRNFRVIIDSSIVNRSID